MSDYEIFELGDVVLQSGITLRQAELAYKTYGKLSTRLDNFIVIDVPESASIPYYLMNLSGLSTEGARI